MSKNHFHFPISLFLRRDLSKISENTKQKINMQALSSTTAASNHFNNKISSILQLKKSTFLHRVQIKPSMFLTCPCDWAVDEEPETLYRRPEK